MRHIATLTIVSLCLIFFGTAAWGQSVIYEQDFADFVFASPPEDTVVVSSFGDQNEWTFTAADDSLTLLYRGDWGSGFSAGFRGNDNVLGYQHTAATGTFAATLSLTNNTGETIDTLGVRYSGRVERAGEGRSPAWTVSVNGDTIPELFYSTVDGIDKVVQAIMVDISIEDGEEIVIIWSSDRDFEGSGSSKQIGIADLLVVIGEFPGLIEENIGWANLQWPPDATIREGTSETVYARIWIDGVTDIEGNEDRIEAFIGINDGDTDPAGWDTWIPAAFNLRVDNDYEYMADIGADLEPGTYYYASRFHTLIDTVFGGFDGGPWDGVDNVSGVLTVLEVVATPTFDPPAGTYYDTIAVTMSTETEDATIHYTLDGTDPDTDSPVFTDPIVIGETTTIKAFAVKEGIEPSDIAEAEYVIGEPIEVETIAELRTKVGDGNVYRLTGEAILTFNSTFRGRKALQDATAGIVIDDFFGRITTEYERYDGITGLTGTVGIFNNLIQFEPVLDPGPATSSDNVVFPEKYTFDDFELEPGVDSSPKQGQLVLLENVTVKEEGQWENQSSYTLVDLTGNTFPIRTDRVLESILYDGETQYIGTDIPEDPINIVGYITQFFGTVQLVPRKLEDMTDAALINNFALTAPADGDTVVVEGEWYEEIVISWEEAVSGEIVSYTWIGTLPGYLFNVPPLVVGSDEEGSATTLTVQKYLIDELFDEIGIEIGETLSLKWTVVAESENGRRYANHYYVVTFERGTVTSVGDEDRALPVEYRLEQNYPNPFNPSTTINFALPEHASVILEVYNTLGQRVRTLIGGEMYDAGHHNIIWDGRNQAGSTVSSGVYIYRIQAGEYVDVKKMMFLK